MAMKPKLPEWPRGLNVDYAAAYVGLSRSTWESLVRHGTAPSAIRLTVGRRVWLREDLDGWLDKQAGRSNDNAEPNDWLSSLAD